jgi:hypothetical protein
MCSLRLQVFQEPALKKAKASVDKAGNFSSRGRMFIDRCRVRPAQRRGLRGLVNCGREKVEEMLAWSQTHETTRKHALLFLFSYCFLLRTPSEALPAIAGEDGREPGSNSVLFKDGEQLVLVLRRRKNKPGGSRLARNCTCRKSAASCAYHLIGQLLDETPVGGQLFQGITANGAFADVRLLGRLGACIAQVRSRR